MSKMETSKVSLGSFACFLWCVHFWLRTWGIWQNTAEPMGRLTMNGRAGMIAVPVDSC